MPELMHDDEIEIPEALVRELLSAHFPELADRALTKVEPWGTDNALWRLGEDLVVRLPRIGWAVDQIEREALWLPRLAPHLPTAIPQPVAIGLPGAGYPFRWAIHRWLEGISAEVSAMTDPVRFALDLAAFARALESVSVDGAPSAMGRARPLQSYNQSALEAIDMARHLIDTDRALEVWSEARPRPSMKVARCGCTETSTVTAC